MIPGFTLDLELAGLPPFRLESDDRRWQEALEPRYGTFMQKPAAKVTPAAVLRLRATSPPPDARALARFHAESVSVERRGGRLTLSSSWCRLTLDRREDQSPAQMAVEVEGPLHRAAVDLALRHLLTELLTDGLLLHGALLTDGARTFLCAGPSGCGKSTLAGLLPAAALCDELAVARRDSSGAWRAWSLPYWHGRPGSGELAAVLLLSHGPECERRALEPAEALRQLASEVIWPAHDAAESGRALALLGALASEVPVASLAFRPEPRVWDLIAAAPRLAPSAIAGTAA